MAFWGVEVKPGTPFTLQYDDSKGRLHISMGTLGLGTAEAKSTLQCNIGNKSPVYLCSLYPGHTESLQLNLEFEEQLHNVTFSVIGTRSIHLCGYYLPNTNTVDVDDSEPLGEDIENTESERSQNSDEDDTDDSFIVDDDDDLEFFPPSPISKKGKKGSRRRLRKKHQTVDSDDDSCFEVKKPNSSLDKNKASGRALDQEMNDSDDSEGEWDSRCLFPTRTTTQTHREAELSDHLVDPCNVLDAGDVKKLKKKKKGKEKENQQYQNHADDKETVTMDKLLPSAEVCQEQGEKKPKKKRKDCSKEGMLEKTADDGAEDFPDGNQSEDKKVKKKKKKSRIC